ncbi:hypothetical protein OV203_19740 [Nannocystis sp. ILAH1]|uniref:hypothetical protein n=1 Tax=unclassified Nannocystis TaxID=2627009 RepID=UPI0022704C19|nr:MULTISPECIES: hypothetical protein [unclassified Nannocystis]MCY0989382.1 hypothetical protein [Nannocystis sp. ILAH1]MCY1064924.1 hypothetical protein [Nannocystis sp. RBIL2]
MMDLRVEELEARADDVEVERAIAELGALAAIRLERHGDTYDIVTWFADDLRQSSLGPQRLVAVDGNMAALKIAELVSHRLAELRDSIASQPPGEEVQPMPATALVLVPPAPSLDAPGFTREGSTRAPVEFQTPRGSPTVTPELDEIDLPLAAPRPPPATHRRRASRGGWVGVAVNAGGGPGGARGLLGGSGSFGWQLAPALSLQAELFAWASPTPIHLDAGSIRVGQSAGQLLFGLSPRGERRVMPRVRVGGGPALVWALGEARSPLRGHDEVAPVGVVTAGIGLAARVRPRLRLYAGVDVHVMTPPARVVVDGFEVLRLGLPLVRGAMGIEWTVKKK